MEMPGYIKWRPESRGLSIPIRLQSPGFPRGAVTAGSEAETCAGSRTKCNHSHHTQEQPALAMACVKHDHAMLSQNQQSRTWLIIPKHFPETEQVPRQASLPRNLRAPSSQ